MSPFVQNVLLGVTAVFYLVGLAGHLMSAFRPLMTMLTPWVLWVFGSLIFSQILLEKRGGILVWALSAWGATWFLEWLGVRTGLVFGAYHYTGVLGPGWDGVPFVIGFNWVLVILGAVHTAQRWTSSPWGAPWLAAGLATLFDAVMEPAAIAGGYWIWSAGVVPLQNYLAWFLIALAASWAYQRGRWTFPSRLFTGYLVIQGTFFLILGMPSWFALSFGQGS